MAWTDGVDKATNDVITAAIWNNYLGATGSLMQAAHLVANVATPTSTTSTSAVDLVTISGLSIPVTAAVLVAFNWRKQALAANAVAFGLKLNSTVIKEAAITNTYCAGSSTTNQAEDGIGVIWLTPRSTSYLSGVISYGAGYAAAGTSGGIGTPAITGSRITNPMPAATITSIAIRAINDTASNAAEVSSVQVWQIGY